MNESNKDNYFLFEAYQTFNNIIFTIYKSITAPYSMLQKMIDETLKEINQNELNLIIAGDFNINLQKDSKNKTDLINHMSSLGLNSLINESFSTDFDTQIDLVFSNSKSEIITDYFESVFSYHKPIWIVIKNNKINFIIYFIKTLK